MAERLLLSHFVSGELQLAAGTGWRGFSDRVMGGVSDASFSQASFDGRDCLRLTGRVTRDRGGGFIQMALDVAPRGGAFDGSAWAGVELVIRGNDEDYSVHVRTADCGWYDESYRAVIHVTSAWEILRIPWAGFEPNGLTVPLDPARLQRIAVLGWMREFIADVSLAELSLYA